MESVLKESGSCGRFQLHHVIFTQFSRFVTVWGIMIMMFGAYDPGWTCNDADNKNSLRLSQRLAINNTHDIELESNKSFNENSVNFRKFWYKTEGNVELYSRRLRNTTRNDTCTTFEDCGSIAFNRESRTIVSEFSIVCDRQWILTVLLITQAFGNLSGALIGGQIGEWFGRKVSLLSGSIIVCLSSLIAIFSPNWIVYAVCLLFIGIGCNLIQSTCSLLSLEFLNSNWRSIFASIPTWNLSLCFLTVAIVLTKNWVYIHIITTVLSFLGVLGLLTVSESIRWLVLHGKRVEAEKVIQKIARCNKRGPISPETLQRLRDETRPVAEKDETTKVYTFLDLFRTKELRTITFKIAGVFFSIFITYYSLGFGVKSLPGNYYVNVVGSCLLEMILCVLVGPVAKTFGRRWTGIIMCGIGAVSCIGIVLVTFVAETGSDAHTISITTFAFLARASSMATSSISSVFMAELFPTAVRNVAFGFIRSISGMGGLFGPFLIPSESGTSFAICFALMALAYVAAIFLFLSLTETNKLCLVDRIEDTGQRKTEEI